MIKIILLFILIVFFALNMGGANFSASFAAAYGGKVLSKKKAQFLFVLFVFLGAIMLGRLVAQTLGKKIIPSSLFDINIILIFFISTSISLFIANLLHVPQSTSLVTVGSLLGIGVYFGKVYIDTLFYLISFWIILPLVGYFLTFFLGRLVYPPRKSNFWIYEKFEGHTKKLKIFVIIASLYNAFSIGTNNVANIVGPLIGAQMIEENIGLALIAPLFGMGAFVFHGPLTTAGEKIVPLGILTSTIVCLVTGTLMIIASLLGVPQSFVMIKLASLFAIGGLKNGTHLTLLSPHIKKTYLVWGISPLISAIISYSLVFIKNVLF